MGFFDFNKLKSDFENKKMLQDTKKKEEKLKTSLNIEKNKIDNENNEIFKKLGKEVFDSLKDLEDLGEDNKKFEESINKIKSNFKAIEEIDVKIKDVEKRYGEEIKMIENLLSKDDEVNVEANTASVDPNQEVCPECKTPRGEGDAFCTGCGHKF